MRIQVPTGHESTTFWKKQRGGNWSCQSTCGEKRDLPPSSFAKNDHHEGSERSASAESDSMCREFTKNNGIGSSGSIERGIRWEHHLPASSHELDLITSSIFGDEHDVLDEILGYKNNEVLTDGHSARLTSCGAYGVMALPATECIDSKFEHNSDLMACIYPKTLMTNVTGEAHIDPNTNCWSFVPEILPFPGRTTGQFEQFMDFIAFPEHHFTFDATQYIQSLQKVCDCIVFPERFFRSDKTLNQDTLAPRYRHSSKTCLVVDENYLSNNGQAIEQKMIIKELEDDKSGCCPTISPLSRKRMLESKLDILSYTWADHEGVGSRYPPSPFHCNTDQTSYSMTDEISTRFLDNPCDAINETDKDEISRGSCILDDGREDEDRNRETGFVTSTTRSLTPDISSVSTLSNKSKTGLKGRDCCATEMGMELVLVTRCIGHSMKKEKSLVKRFFGAVRPPSSSKYDRC